MLDYDETSLLTGYSPAYVKKLCDTGRLGFVTSTYYVAHRRRRVRRVPYSALVAFLEALYTPPRRPPRATR